MCGVGSSRDSFDNQFSVATVLTSFGDRHHHDLYRQHHSRYDDDDVELFNEDDNDDVE